MRNAQVALDVNHNTIEHGIFRGQDGTEGSGGWGLFQGGGGYSWQFVVSCRKNCELDLY